MVVFLSLITRHSSLFSLEEAIMGKEEALQRLYQAIVSCDDEESEKWAKVAIEENVDPTRLMETAIKGIEKVGAEFSEGKVFVPELMLAGMGMEKVMALAQKKLLDQGLVPVKRATLIIGSVAGDVHTIGKDLVATLWRAKGFQVHDLGVGVPSARFASAAAEMNADIVGLSALMTTTLPEQREVIDLFKRKGLRDRCKIIVGGGVCTPAWADQIGADGYAEDAGRAVELVEKLIQK
jgi:dimethylamine corrinoid protein